MATEDNLRKALTFTFAVIGLGIFYVVIMTKLEVMAQETKATVLKTSADESWGDFLYEKTIDSIIENRESQQAEEPTSATQPE